MGEGALPTKADAEAYVELTIKEYDRAPWAGVELAARRVAADTGIRGWRELADQARARIEDR